MEKGQELTTLEEPRVAASATEAWMEEAVPKVGTGGAAVTARAPVGKGMGIWVEISAGAAEARREVESMEKAVRKVVECMLDLLFFRDRLPKRSGFR